MASKEWIICKKCGDEVEMPMGKVLCYECNESRPRLFQNCGNCGQEIPEFALGDVFERHYNAQCKG